MVVSHLSRSHWRKVNSEETEQMKSLLEGEQTLTFGWTPSPLLIIIRSPGARGGPGGARGGPLRSLPGYHCWPSKSPPPRLCFAAQVVSNREISILDYKLTNLSPQEIVFFR